MSFRLARWAIAFLALLPSPLPALTNNLAATPPMGWNDWNTFGCGISDAVVRQTADAMAANGMMAAGYQFINIDDCWAASRDANGVIVVNSSKFPNGIKALADYVHAKGLKLGIYTDHGTNTCSSSNPPGSYGYEYVDAFTYASWGVDYLKNDSCKLPLGDVPYGDYFRMADGLMQSGRSIVASLCPNSAHYEYWSPDVGNLWRTTGDIHNTFSSMVGRIDPNSKSAYLAGPGRWNDPDMLEVGNGEFTDATNAQSHFTMWCLMAAPLIAGNDIRSASAQTLSILTNPEVIAVDQDPAGEQGVFVAGVKGSAEVWSKPLGYDYTTRAVALFNRTTNATNITCFWTNLAMQAGSATVRDLWAHTDLGSFINSFTTNVPAQGTVLLKIVGTPMPPPPLGTSYLSDLQPIYAYTGFGTLIKDKSIGNNTLTLNGVTYSKGIGTHAIGGHEFDLGCICSRFQSDIGVDDEVGTSGSVIFQVFADGTKIYDSGILTGASATKTIDLDVTGVRRLTLGVTDTGNDDAGNRNSFDHSDWANARVVVTNTTPQRPAVPTGLAAATGNSVALAWSNALAATSYNVKRSTTSGGPYTAVANIPFTAFNDTNVSPGGAYFYVVSAVSSFGESSNSLEVGVVPCNPPVPPTNVTTTVGASQVVLRWNAAPGATTYTLARFTGNTPPVTLASGWVATNFTDMTVAPGVIYYYLVSAANACSRSAPAPFVAAVMPSIPPPSPPTWNGGSPVDGNWSDPANWAGTNIAAGNSLVFDGATRLDNTNDTTPGTLYSNITINPGASAFSLNGKPLTLAGSITNNSPNPQTLLLGLNFSNSVVLSGTTGMLVIGSGLTNTMGAPGFTTLTLSGMGNLTNLMSSANNPGGTNVVLLNDANANWTLLDNASFAPMTVPWVLSINRGTLNYGTASSAPTLILTTPNNVPQDNQAGVVSGAIGAFNMINGTLTTSARLNTATANNSTGILNQVGGTLNLGSQFQGANGANAGEVSLVTLSGGVLNISGGSGPFYVASRGGGTLTLSGAGALNCGTLDVSRNANGNAIGSVGLVNLNGGTLLASRVGTATANAQTNWLNGSAATFNFNGGTLKINSSTPPFFQGSTVPPFIPINAIVKAGGALIDSNGQTNIFAEPLLHDASLGSAPDGGLTKAGAGSLTLVSNLTYTGNTTVNAGTLALSNAAALNTSPLLSVAANAVLDASGRLDGTLTLVSGQTLTGNGTLRGNVFVGAGATLAPGNPLGTLSFSNNLTLSGGGSTLIGISKSAGTNGLVQVASNLVYGGTLALTNVGSSPFSAGDSFKLFTAANYSGAFTNLTPAIPAVNLAWSTNTLSSNGRLSIISSPTPPPRFKSLAANGSQLLFTGTNGVPNWTYYVLASANVALPVANWAVVATNEFDSGGNFTFSLAPAPGGGQGFYLLRLR